MKVGNAGFSDPKNQNISLKYLCSFNDNMTINTIHYASLWFLFNELRQDLVV